MLLFMLSYSFYKIFETIFFGGHVVKAMPPNDFEPVVAQESLEVVVNPKVDFKVYYQTSDLKVRQNLIRRYLEDVGYSENDIDTFLAIGQRESGLQLDSEPPVFVKHCRRANGSFYVVEINSTGGQAECKAGDKQVHQEKSYGIFQILPSTAKGYGCSKDLTTLESQLECAVKLQKSTKSWNHWTTYKLVKN